MDETTLGAYLRRIGAERPAAPTAAALGDLHIRHLHTIPFENLDLHLGGQQISLAEKDLLAKLLDGERGGVCYELNGSFGALLRALGYRVRFLSARVYMEDGAAGIPYGHLALLVETSDGQRLLADVGFGDHFHHPIAFDERGDQRDPAGVFRIVPAEDGEGAGTAAGSGTGTAEDAPDHPAGGDLVVLNDGKPVYRIDTRPRAMDEFTAAAWWTGTSPDSPFTRAPLCSRVTESGGRATISGRRLITTPTADGERTVRVIEDDAELLASYHELFGVRLPRLPDRTDAPR
ncbi:arylamine N-acetyltransferase [Streptomyces sp. NPDC089799]|uniref:arylamine N-acetyltransferase family protein n=1 Tax=Streptomyces sp. NPDC089799 TaxID=3155066 RepID=UPI003414F511